MLSLECRSSRSSHIRQNAIGKEREIIRGDCSDIVLMSYPPFHHEANNMGKRTGDDNLRHSCRSRASSLEEAIEPIACFLHHVHCHSMADYRLALYI